MASLPAPTKLTVSMYINCSASATLSEREFSPRRDLATGIQSAPGVPMWCFTMSGLIIKTVYSGFTYSAMFSAMETYRS